MPAQPSNDGSRPGDGSGAMAGGRLQCSVVRMLRVMGSVVDMCGAAGSHTPSPGGMATRLWLRKMAGML